MMSDTNNTQAQQQAILPFLAIDAKYLAEQTPRFTEALAAYAANPEDVTGLRLYNLCTMAKSLKGDYERIHGLLERLDTHESEPTQEHGELEVLPLLAAQGLEITSRAVGGQSGWGYCWKNYPRKREAWVGPFPTPTSALHAAFTEVLFTFQLRDEHQGK
jgi:hypothetical protein